MSRIETITWQDDHIRILDQTRLPVHEEYLYCRDVESVALAIERLSVRGAPAIGVAAAMALALGAVQSRATEAEKLIAELEAMSRRLLQTRPTAVNLQWAVSRMMRLAGRHARAGADELRDTLRREAVTIYEQDMEINRNIGRHGQALLRDSSRIMTICNTGSLATAGYGTALGVIRAAAEHGKEVFVAVCETRPLLQGARLTAWELTKDGIPFELITDSMAAFYMKKKGADMVIAGADRIAANGDTANKVGTYAISLAAKSHGIPFYIAAPTSTIDTGVAGGDEIPIEERHPDEITCIAGQRIAPEAAQVWNPAFDVVPNMNIDGIITERGIVREPFKTNIASILEKHN